jgi:Flp pilus assembly protein TadG
MPVLICAVGFGVDFGYASLINQGLYDAADSAVLAATSQSAATAGGGYGDTSWLQNYGIDVFQGNIAKLGVSNVSPTVTVVSNGTGGVVATASYSYAVPTFFSSIFGMTSIPVSGQVQAVANPITYINFYIVTDISQSMGIAATAADMTTLYNRVAQYGNGSEGEAGCVFGCHVTSPGQSYTNEYLAHNITPKVTLRIDSAVAAIQTAIALAQTNAGTNQNLKIGLYTMSEDPVTGKLVNTISAPSSNYSNLKTLAQGIDLGNNTTSGFGDSDFADQISTLNGMIPANGSGASAASPLNYVFIITDGLSDVPNSSCPDWHCTSALQASICSTLKTKATVGVIYTTYSPIYNQNNSALGYEALYSQLVVPYVGQIAANLQACATSSNFYYQANNGPAISTGIQTLFASSFQMSHLTQ